MKTADTPHVMNFLKYIGYITMIIDHVGVYLFPGNIWLRIIGRIAYPCFIYGVITGIHYTSNIFKYAGRMLLMGLFGNIALGAVYPLSIGFTLTILIMGLDSYKKNKKGYVVLFGLFSFFTEYSVYGFLLGLAMYQWKNNIITKRMLSIYLVLLHVMVWIFMNAPLQLFMVLFFVVYKIATKVNIQIPNISKELSYAFYPVHIGLLRIIQYII